jgi:hypothetical protein
MSTHPMVGWSQLTQLLVRDVCLGVRKRPPKAKAKINLHGPTRVVT